MFSPGILLQQVDNYGFIFLIIMSLRMNGMMLVEDKSIRTDVFQYILIEIDVNEVAGYCTF